MTQPFDYLICFNNGYDSSIIDNHLELIDKTDIFKTHVQEKTLQITNIMSLYPKINNMVSYLEYNDKIYKICCSII